MSPGEVQVTETRLQRVERLIAHRTMRLSDSFFMALLLRLVFALAWQNWDGVYLEAYRDLITYHLHPEWEERDGYRVLID